jgi:hypothetical protein
VARTGLSLLLTVYLCFVMWLAPMRLSRTEHAPVTGLSILENDGFESGLLNWGPIESGDRDTAVSGSVFHSGVNSLLLDLKPTSLTNVQVEGASPSAWVDNLRALSFEARLLTPSRSFLVDNLGRIVVQVEGLTVNYDAQATYGGWIRMN